ncbi:Carboxylesterase family [Popillia japonica]|uniref:Carboxylesterase family n=1 Tax=Popillia japonica TaxID=7064 RepID=A0AAW1L3T3_POPJA
MIRIRDKPVKPFKRTRNTEQKGVLFHRAILMSGSALSPWALVQEPSRYAAQVAIHANCSLELPHSYLLKCLREKPLEVLMSAPIIAQEFAFAFGPSVDGVVIDTGEPPGRYINNAQEFAFAFGPSVDGVVIDTGEPPARDAEGLSAIYPPFLAYPPRSKDQNCRV